MASVLQKFGQGEPSDPELLTLTIIRREVISLLGSLRLYQAAAWEEDAPESLSGVHSRIEQICIHQRILRILLWVQLRSSCAKGAPAEAEIQSLTAVLCDAAALRETTKLTLQNLPPDLKSASQRSQALLARVARLNESFSREIGGHGFGGAR